jgi:hypothetical protein
MNLSSLLEYCTHGSVSRSKLPSMPNLEIRPSRRSNAAGPDPTQDGECLSRYRKPILVFLTYTYTNLMTT